MDLKYVQPQKVVSAAQAISKIERGSRIFIGTGCGEPQHLIHTLVDDQNLQDIMVYQMLSSTLSRFVDDPAFLRRFLLKLFFISVDMRKAAFEGKIDYVPAYLSQIPRLFANKSIGLDVALVQVSPPDRFGYCSLGISVDITRSALENADMVIAQVNPKMPRTWGDSFAHVDDIDFMVWHEEPLVEYLPKTKNLEIARRIGLFVEQLIEDGATLQLGFGHIPNAILPYLTHKKDLGVHTHLITDGMIPLFKKQVITNKQKTLLPGRTVASLCMGSEALYRYVDNNPMFYFRSSDFVNDPSEIARNDNMLSISSALEIDLTGQVSNDSLGNLFFSGIGDQVDFLRGSAMSRGGYSIIALPSTARKGSVSRIVPSLSTGAGVATARGDVNFVVTEYGIAELTGKSIYQRVMELAQIAHPKFRAELIGAAKKNHYIFADQLPPSQDDLLFLEGYKCSRQLPNGKTVEFRPLLPSDEFEFRNFFYSLQEKTIYLRFFHKKKLLTHEMAQKQWSAVDYKKNMSLLGLVRNRQRKEIMAIGSYAKADTHLAEVAFLVREDFQRQGIASYLLRDLEKIARANDYSAFMATVLKENKAMLRVFQGRYPNLKVQSFKGELELLMDFSDAVEPEAPSESGCRMDADAFMKNDVNP
jgi:acyl-CoA hydrolase/GNAT superfamily N-acetyltransferase